MRRPLLLLRRQRGGWLCSKEERRRELPTTSDIATKLATSGVLTFDTMTTAEEPPALYWCPEGGARRV